ncbi:MAG: ATPase, T2SS/T4P/T4SS family [Candidatus Omnitrophota bacterium]|jgi:type II secretory ATPase GspE/PulE/Tfp pilus assembly ATPase PilB-like protein
MKPADKILAKELIRRGVLPSAVVEEQLKVIENTAIPLKNILVERNLMPEQDLLQILSGLYSLEVVNLRNYSVDPSVVEHVPVRFAWYYKFMPIKITGKSVLVACANPLDLKVQDEIRVHLALEPQIVLAKEQDVLDALNKYYGLAADTLERMSKDAAAKPGAEIPQGAAVEDLDEGAQDVTVARLVNQILLEAYKKRATDIHIEPYRNNVRVRYRIDGSLVDANIPPAVKDFLPSIISRIKIISNLSIVEKRLPQDGSAVVKTQEQTLDLRISTIPTPHGESMVVRILPTQVMLLSLEKLGLDQKNLEVFRRLVKRPHGIILVTGPTGSGKTTTLYACLHEINSTDRKIITLEDPLEYEMEGITQIQVNPRVDLDFAIGLRSVLRHDPDIIMVGEIRDLETAEIAIRTALTGHLVFSTLHTNDAASGITRLIEMGLEPFLVSSSIEAFIAQRLVRIICPHCKEEDLTQPPEIKEELAASLGMNDLRYVKVFHGRGCDFCNQTGFYGRTAIYEILAVDEDIRAAILEKQRTEQIKRLAVKRGMITLRQNGWQKVLAGITTPAEVINVTVKDDGTHEENPPAANVPGMLGPGTQKNVRLVDQDILAVKDDYNSRAYERAEEKVNIRYSIVRQDPQNPLKLFSDQVEHASVTRDISAGGLRFVSGYTLPVGTIIDIRIQLVGTEKSIDCLARVCRVEDDNLSAMFNIVVYYLDIPSADRVRIDHFVQEQRKKKKETPGL